MSRPSSFRAPQHGGCGSARQAWPDPARRALLHTIAGAAALVAAGAGVPARAAEPLKVVALGDSLTAGLGLPAGEAYPAKLQAALAARGLAVAIDNAGVSGDTVASGLARLDWSVPDGTQAVLLELGANDMLRGIDPATTRAGLEAILGGLKARAIPVMMFGMRAAPNLGPDYQKAFDPIFPDLARAHGVPLYPFFLDGVAGQAGLNQPDGMHPNAAGVDAIVARMTPAVEAFLRSVAGKG